ncbi:MAG: class I SAM-dependent methyltransferase [Deltaproteobacteria bacterium]|nr:class I SAM-dependent methyltransferase [Deltaproteobacteria bacterium]
MWGLDQLEIDSKDIVLDIGCGGGINIQRMLKRANMVCGMDISESSVAVSTSLNRKEIAQKRCEIKLASVAEIPFSDGMFDLVTAFETVYFWPDLVENFREVRRVLKTNGKFFVCNTLNPEADFSKMKFWIDMLDMEKAARTDYENVMEEAGFTNITKFGKEDIGITIRGENV